MELLLVQPPLVQLNAPYPAIAYLRSFCRQEGHTARCIDLSIELFHAVFSGPGLALVFDEAENRIARLPSMIGPTRKNILRYLSNADRYVESIDRIVGLLSRGDDAFARALSAGCRVPYGHRSEGFLEANDGEIAAADAPLLASLIVEDIADLITFALDHDFSLVRYGESKASSQPDFRVVEEAARASFLFEAFLRPLVQRLLAGAARPDLVCVTIPFPGTLPGALAFAAEAKRLLGRDLPIAFGGGYVSTELRRLRDTGIFGYADYLCYDAGYGALSSILASLGGAGGGLFKTIVSRDGMMVASGFDGPDLEFFRSERLYQVDSPADPAALRGKEAAAIRNVFPDYSDIDFSRYVKIVEGTNPMHTLWSDTKWMKARLAHGCYWRKCAFCDTELDYIARFSPSSPEALLAHLLEQSRITGQSGVHLVDEALPVPQLMRFGLENLRRGRPLTFWGNARLERRFTADACAVLAEAGLVGISAGLEIATDRGLASTRKGLALPDIVGSLLALKTNGILVHGYLIYGWPGQAEGEIIDSMEIVRQLFAARLLDSAFWHKLILTRWSPLYAEWKAGLRADFAVEERDWAFGSNDLAFEGEERFTRYGPALDTALGAWLERAELDRDVRAWFDFRVPRPSVPAECISALARAARRKQESPEVGRDRRIVWLGGRLVREPVSRTASGPGADVRFFWSYRNRLEHVDLPASRAATLAAALPGAVTMEEFLTQMNADGGAPFEETRSFRKLRLRGLAAI